MFGIGSTEILVIVVVALVVLGPKSLPGIAKTVGKVMGEFRKVSTEFQRAMYTEQAQEEHEKLKKEAEEELFGDNKKDASTAKSSPKNVEPEVSANASAEVSPEETKQKTVDASYKVGDTIVKENSPVAEAVQSAFADASGISIDKKG